MAVSDGSTRVVKSISELKTAQDLTAKLDELKKRRSNREKDWKLNLAFYQGNQYVFVNRSGRLDSVPTEDGEKPRYRVRLTANQIETGAQSLLSKFTKTKPVLHATPGSSADADLRAAQLADQLLDSWWGVLALEDKLEEALLWAIIASQGYWKISWDEHAGTPMKFVINPETGQVMTDDSQVTAYKAMLEQMGLPPDITDQTVYLGDVRIDVMSPFQVWLDDTAKTFSECKWAICEHNMTPEEIKTRFKVDVKADSVPVDPAAKGVLYDPNSTTGDGSTPSVKKVYYGYFVPSPAIPKGRYVVWMETKGSQDGRLSDQKSDTRKNILADTPWPYPFNELPLVKFPGVRVPGSIYDDAVVTHARPLQKELNRTLSQIIEYKNLTIKPRVWAPIGSLKTRLTTEPGAVYEFQPIAGLKPEIEQLPSMPPYVFEHLKDVTMRLREVFGLNEITEGTLPPNVEAGVAIDLLQEMSTDRFAPQIKSIETALAKAAKLLLSLAQEYYVEERMLRINGNGGSMQVKKFKGADINGVDVMVEAGSGLPRTRAGRQARIKDFIDMGVMEPHKAWKYLDIADLKGMSQQWAADEDQAYREHEKLLSNEPLNPLAVQNAMQAVQMGQNPETGEAIQDESEVQQILTTAALTPGISDNHITHLEVHGGYMKTVEFSNLPIEIQQLHVQHFMLTQDAAKAVAPIPDGQAPRVNLALKGTLGPTVAAEIMQRAGVDASPEDFLEQPLETWITDSVDKPDVDEAGNDPFTEAEQAMAMQRNQEKHDLEQAKMVHEMALAEQKAELDAEKQRQASRNGSE